MSKTRDICEVNVTTRKEHIHSLGFLGCKRGVTLQRVTLWGLRCICPGLWLIKDNKQKEERHVSH